MRILNIGGGPKNSYMPPFYKAHVVEWLDIDPQWEPDLEMDARDLDILEAGTFDGVYGSHVLEHFAPHDLKTVLAGVLHVLKPGGFADFRVPDVWAAVRAMVDNDADLYAHLYDSPAGPITTRDVLWGYARFVEQFGDHHAHRNGFTRKTLADALYDAGFGIVYSRAEHYEVRAIAAREPLEDDLLKSLGVVL